MLPAKFSLGKHFRSKTAAAHPRAPKLDAPLGDVPLYYIEKHVKQTFLFTLTIPSSIKDFLKTRSFRRSSMAMFKRSDIGKMFHKFGKRGPCSRGNRKSFNLDLWDRIYPPPLIPRNCELYILFSKIKCVIVLYWLLMMKRRCIKWWTIGKEKYFEWLMVKDKI